MISILAPTLALALQAAATAAPVFPPSPAAVVAAAPAGAWVAVPVDDLLVMELKGGRRVVIQLAPGFAPAHVANIRALAGAGWWDGASVNRVQDNYVVQWGVTDEGRKLPAGVAAVPPAEFDLPSAGLSVRPLGSRDAYAPAAGFAHGWPVAVDGGRANLVHCYGMVGAGRGLAPDTGSGAELYVVTGHAPRHLDRNMALVGRVIEGIDALTALPRGTEALGFYRTQGERLPIVRVAPASALPPGERLVFEMMRTDGAAFGAYVAARANRRDGFFVRPAGAVDLCNVPVPVRRRP